MTDQSNPKDPAQIAKMAADADLQTKVREVFLQSCRYNYSYNFSWLGRPMIQYPEDIMAMQEIVWKVKPDLIVETGIAHGGSLIFYASLLELLGGKRCVLGVDIDIREHNRVEIDRHPMAGRIQMIQGSSVDESVVTEVFEAAKDYKTVLVVLDSNHTHAHVLQELQFYSKLVTRESYLVVFDTVVEDMPKSFFPDRPWGPGNNPKTAVREFLETNPRFEVDRGIQDKLLFTVAPEGYLKCLSD
jgi:cephalosporin hydroxylase